MSGTSEPVPDAAHDVGAMLRRHREAAHRSLRDLADITKLGVRTLEALEKNQIDKLPPGIFRRAVVRAYAKEVGLDPEHTLRTFLTRFPDHLPPPGVPVGPVADARGPATSPQQWLLAGIVIGIVAVLLLLAGWWWMHRPAAAATARRLPAAVAAAQVGVSARGRGK